MQHSSSAIRGLTDQNCSKNINQQSDLNSKRLLVRSQEYKQKGVIYSKLTTETLERVVSFLLTFNISHAFFWCCYSCLWAGECLLGCDRNLFVLKIIAVDTGWAFPSKSSKNIWQLSPSRSLYIDYEQVFAHWSSPPLLEHHNNVRNLFKVNNKETTTTSFTSF